MKLSTRGGLGLTASAVCRPKREHARGRQIERYKKVVFII